MSASTSTFTAGIEITINGVTIRRVNYLRINQRFESHHDFEISVSPEMLAGQTNKLFNMADTFVGQRATIKLTQGRAGATAQNQVFMGGVTSVKLLKGQSQTDTYLISGLSPTMFLSAGRKTCSFENKTLSDIVTICCGTSGVSKSPAHTAPIPYVTQYEEDKFHFLQRLAERYGEWFYYDGETIIFGKNARTAKPAIQLVNGSNLFDMEYGLRVVPLRFKTSYFSYEEFQRFSADSNDQQVSGLHSFSQMAMGHANEIFIDDTLNTVEFQDFVSEAELGKSVKLKKSEQTNKLAVLNGRTPEMELKIGNLIHVKELVNNPGPDEIDYGTFVVSRVGHSIDSFGVYQAVFEAIPQDVNYPPADYRIVAPKAQPQLAVVRDTADPLELGRVRVQFWWQGPAAEEEGKTPWIRVSSAMTGASKSYFIPEVNDTVMVDFEYGNPDLPYVAGSLYAKDDGPRKPGSELFRSDNHIKGIITRGGNHIIIDDEDGKEKISIFNKENKNKIELSLDGGPHMNIHSDGTINMSATNINIKASEELKMEGKNLVGIDSDSMILVKSKDNTEIRSTSITYLHSDDKCLIHGSRVGIVADSEIKVECVSIEVAAEATAAIKANAQLSLEGSGMAELKGGMVMIN